METKMKRFISALCLAAWCAVPLYADDSREDIRQFGDHLFSQGDFYRAITEYERYLFLADAPDGDAQAVKFNIASAYYWGEKWDAAGQRFLGLKNTSPDTPAGKLSILYLASIAEKQKRPLLAVDYLETYLQAWPKEPAAPAAREQLILNYMQLNNREQAEQVVDATGSAAISRDDIDRYFALPRKSPLAAGVLSAVLPGAGQAYNRHWGDAVLSFAINAVFIGGTYAAFDNDEEVLGVFLALMETTWYTGNIYNAVNGAHQYNRQQKDRFLRNLKMQYGLGFPPGTGSGPTPFIGLSTAF